MKVLIIGRGRVGKALERSLESSGLHEVRAANRRWKPSSVRDAGVVVLAVPDDSIEALAEDIAPHLKRGAVVLHCAGSRSFAELGACESVGASVGIMHPLVSLPSARSHPSFRGTTFTSAGSRRAITAGRRIAEACGARVLTAPTGDPGYHAAAALTANGAAALAYVSVGVLEHLGVDRRGAERAIGGLLQSVGENVQRLGVPGALTGPIARGETGTVERHRNALRRLGRDGISAYDAVLPIIVGCARAAGLSRAKASTILRSIKG